MGTSMAVESQYQEVSGQITAPMTKVIADASEFLILANDQGFADTEKLSGQLIAVGVRVQSMSAVLTLAEAMLAPGAASDETLKRDLRLALRIANGQVPARAHYTGMARDAVQAEGGVA